jgi:enoyl-CoA hydratase
MGAVVRISELETAYVERDGNVGRIVLNRPERRNAINPQLVVDFQRALDVVEADDEISVVIVKGEGSAFCSGYDMTAHVVGDGDSPPPKRREQWEDYTWTARTARNYTRLWEMRKPTIAQVHGYCLAGGCMLALQCDLVYVAEDALIGQPQVRALGMNPDFALWPLTIGLRQSKELLYTGDVVSGTEAAQLGMVNRALPAGDLEAHVEWMAGRIALVPGPMLQFTKQAVNEAADAMGYRGMLLAGIHADTFQHFLDSNEAFKEKLRADRGAKMAVNERDRRQGGLRARTTLWDEYLRERPTR